MSVAPPDFKRRDTASGRPRQVWALAIVVVAVLAVAAALVVGLRGLTGDPVKGTAPDGSTILEGTWGPRSCCPAEGYLQAGGRLVFVIFPSGCPAPAPNSDVTAHARRDASQGAATYRAVGCATVR